MYIAPIFSNANVYLFFLKSKLFVLENNFSFNVFRIWEDDSGDLQFELVSEKPLKQEYLQSGVSFKFAYIYI